jgi:hypothetical protein
MSNQEKNVASALDKIKEIETRFRGPQITHDQADELRAAIDSLRMTVDIADRLPN